LAEILLISNASEVNPQRGKKHRRKTILQLCLEKLECRGRTNQMDLAWLGLFASRLHATFERHGSDEIWFMTRIQMNGTSLSTQADFSKRRQIK